MVELQLQKGTLARNGPLFGVVGFIWSCCGHSLMRGYISLARAGGADTSILCGYPD
jgi:hypothetical protein